MPLGVVVPASGPDPLQARIVAALRAQDALRHNGEPVRLIETHISYVLLTGAIAYKIKKAVRLGFLDFGTLEKRRFYCEEELRLNRRLAPSIYLGVVAITGDPDRPAIDGDGPVLEYAVRMQEFPQDALLSALCDRDELAPRELDDLASRIARFHAEAGVATPTGPHGSPEAVLNDALANFDVLAPLLVEDEERARLDGLRAWTLAEHAAIRSRLAVRLEWGFVRECHGDLHLGNIALVDGEIVVFDCIEFNASMRWIDVASEVAFAAMDLHDRGRPQLAHRFVDAYLQATGDFGAVALLPFHLVYRAMVRAKVAGLRASQLAPGIGRAQARADCRDCIALAESLSRPRPRSMALTHGLAGCGKTTISQALLEATGVIRIRTDVERKRLAGLESRQRSDSGVASGLYSDESTHRTYAHALSLARTVVEGGASALVDGTFLARWQRDLFRDGAAAFGVPLIILAVQASDGVLRRRVARRARIGRDASEADVAVLEHQIRALEPLGPDEAPAVVALDGEGPAAALRSTPAWQDVVARLAPSQGARPDEDAREAEASARTVAFLSRPASYPEGTSHVERIETHLSWLFLTERHAYKLKKRVRTDFVDLRTLAARRRSAAEEVRLNRRLTTDVYLGAVPLLQDGRGRLSFERGDDIADWVVRMRRLPRERMLDSMLAAGLVTRTKVDAMMERLCAFYRRARPSAQTTDEYLDSLETAIAEDRHELSRPEFGLDRSRVSKLCDRQLAMLACRAMFDARIRSGRVVEVHGDLRPEHICLDEDVQVIDCLDFSRALRLQDAADEVGFLALECERLGAPLRDALLDAYRSFSGDDPPDQLVHFHQSCRAAIRAKIAIWHLRDPDLGRLGKWRAQATCYLELAEQHIERCREACSG